jgi:hypothetical protein
MKRTTWIVAVCLLLLAFAVRLQGLTATSLWYDETFMLYHAEQPVGRAVLGLLQEDNALPLHGLLLALWVKVAGVGEFAGRFLSVLLGLLGVAFVFRLGAAVTGRREGGWGAALAIATLPIHVYYAQEVRMYALAVSLAAAFGWRSWHLVQAGRGERGYVLWGALMLISHLYAGLLWATVLIWGTAVLLLRGARLRRWLHTNLLLGVVALPVAGWALWRMQADATAGASVSPTVVRTLPASFGVAQYLELPWSALFTAVTLVSLATAVVGLLYLRRGAAALWIVAGLFLPVLLLLVAALLKPKWNERYLLASLGVVLVVGVGVGWELLRRYLPIVAVTFTTLWLILTLPANLLQARGVRALVVQDEWHPRPDFRAVARYIEEHDTPRDAIAVVSGYAAHTLDYYYDGPAHLFGLPPDVRVLDLRHLFDMRALEVLQAQVGDAERLWLVLWQESLTDPTQLVQSVLVDSCELQPVQERFLNVGVLLFDLSSCKPLDQLARPVYPQNVPFNAPIYLVGYDVIRTGETWEVDLWWRTEDRLPETYHVFVHLLSSEGELVSQHDHIAGADLYPTPDWDPGTYLRDRFYLIVPGGYCPECFLQVGLYTEAGRLPLQTGEEAIVLPLPADER